MKKLTLFLGLSLISAVAVAAAPSQKVTYSGASLAAEGITTVSQVVSKYSETTKIEPSQDLGKTLFLVDGLRTETTQAQADQKLADGKSVEVMSNGDAVVVNVVTK